MAIARPGTTILPFAGKTPRIDDSAFIAPGVRIIGDVEIGPDSSIWYNCVLRGDVNRIVIGARTNIQDGTVVHCDGPDGRHPGGYPTLIGDDVLIGHLAMIHGCTLADRAFVGLSATVMNGCTVESDGMLAANAMLSPGKTVGSRQLWIGSPAKYARDLNDAAVAEIQGGVARYVENGRAHFAALAALEGDGTGQG
ncbi:gamma carbonic anhydrase family protein [Croceicoccus estronivorus]|uniref:gamma carbonic anhydrase family protein n=1 Tax=Croceicoccus estronivorus TaxID=1172626 RepID=UPI00082A79CC|nr:gamma carbonic anhydrase family protein [Croceicoccus estronivorus]OCC24015.1 gamma carbonic anhydrase family protein [Croceicoccus estronivorus]